jgi:hypothetical protein
MALRVFGIWLGQSVKGLPPPLAGSDPADGSLPSPPLTSNFPKSGSNVPLLISLFDVEECSYIRPEIPRHSARRSDELAGKQCQEVWILSNPSTVMVGRLSAAKYQHKELTIISDEIRFNLAGCF